MASYSYGGNYGMGSNKKPKTFWERTKEDIKEWMEEHSKLVKIMKWSTISLIALIVLLNSFYRLDTGWNAVVMRWGKVVTVETSPGPHIKFPFVESVKKVNLEKRYKIEYGYRTKKAGDEKNEPVYEDIKDEAEMIVGAKTDSSSIVLMNIIIAYNISNPTDYLFKVDDLEGTLKLALEAVLRDVMPDKSVQDVLTQKEVIDQEVLPALQKKMNEYQAGIKIIEVKTQNTHLLPKVDEAYKSVEQANQYKNSKIQQAQQYKNTVVPQGEAEAKQITEAAKGYAATTVSDAKSSVAQFNALYDAYLKNPDIVKEKYYIDAMNNFLKNNKVIIDTTDNGQVHKFFNMGNENAIKEEATQGGK